MNDLPTFLWVSLPVFSLVTNRFHDVEMKGGVYFTRDQALSPNTCKELLSPPQALAIQHIYPSTNPCQRDKQLNAAGCKEKNQELR